MEYKLFDEYITLQALLKELSIIHSGGAIKGFLAKNTVLFNGEDEQRRGKKLRYGDVITIPSEEIEITIVAPTTNEIEEHQNKGGFNFFGTGSPGKPSNLNLFGSKTTNEGDFGKMLSKQNKPNSDEQIDSDYYFKK